MTIDLLGIWQGTYQTDGLTYFPQLFDQKGNYVGGIGAGGPAETLNVSLNIKWQGDFETFYYNLKASAFYGELVGVQWDSIPVSGFVNEDGYIKLSFYTDRRPAPPNVMQTFSDWTFNSFLIKRGGYRIMSGDWAITSFSQGIISYQTGTLSVKRKISLKERASMYIDVLRMFFK